ncbi:MAG: helix-turn-helix domain-containing protein [Rhodospirillaceae bacterium]|nr:helix-turn-helix domain-containing protein [Rhodospirillaceae bacterium]
MLAGFSDAQISRALNAVHNALEFRWTLEDLAKVAGMSRTSFATKFAQLMSMTPVAYITHWRMQIARQQLAETD